MEELGMRKLLKITLISVMFIIIVTINGCKGKGSYEALTMEQLEIKLENQESFIFVVKSRYCGHCTYYEPIVKEYVDNEKITIYYIDVADSEDESITQESLQNLKAKIEAINEEYDKLYTPATVIVEKGELKEALLGYNDYEELEDFLK